MIEDRVAWDTLWMTMVLTVAQRSIDPSTKHGCIIVDEKNRLISMGYNSFPRDCVEDSLPTSRPNKYKVIIHSETNAIINAANGGLIGATAYITGFPCTNCFANMLNAGITKIIYGPVGSHCLDVTDVLLVQKMNIDSKTLKNKIEIIKYQEIADMGQIVNFLEQIKNYTNDKTGRTDLING